MSTSVITVKVDSKTKSKFQDIAQQLGMPISSLIRGFIRHLIQTRRVEYSLNEKPTQYLIDALRKSEEDIKKGNMISFNNPKEELSYLQTLIKENERK
ncbi:MAG: hypothetical protein US54_C0001G0052 [Candidatus Roizmanbacteria bacterium GW2011_GWA2_37_7]|uniref:Addiction module antitoxin, RelB/DinJ family n=1 Tax=Candidatus Roizmanbacteria bacterium GW2011_GWA2_37_7 TaxID=1618481 RepID=A0A0G0H9W2_9BACT|nr:MAG: hypothetical protein US54_C0001G0052 [Candidatus Roizmanbacteria bacterium GW2011_GWA2_37_7]